MDNFVRQTSAGSPARGDATYLPPRPEGYRAERLLGVGAGSTVWLIRPDTGGNPCALKVMTPSETAAADNHAHMIRELRLLQRYTHEHLVAVHELMPTDQGPALRMDFAAGDSLLRLVSSRGGLSIGETVTILTPLAQVLAYLHAGGAVHGDVSPGNVLFTAEGKPLLGDLGVGRLLGEETQSRTGTPGFTDPAGIQDPSRLGTASDIYSLSALGWYALTGKAPDPALHRPPLSLIVPGVPAELVSLIEAGLHEDPSQRPPAIGFARAVAHAAQPVPVDLVAAVHPTVLPELRTRRAVHHGSPAKTRARLRGVWPARTRRAGARGAAAGAAGNSTGRVQFKAAAIMAVLAAALVICGALLAVPHLITPVNAEGAPGQDRTTAAAPAQEETELTSQLRERLADQDPLIVLGALATVRARAYSLADAGLLEHVNVAGSPAMASDRAALDGLISSDHVYQGLSVRLEDVRKEFVPGEPTSAGTAVSARAVTSAYIERARTGETVREQNEPTVQELTFVLKQQDGAWKIHSVHEAGAA